MDKLTMAHDWAMKILEGNMRAADASDLVERAWQYADAMQAEADKREDKTRPDVLRTEDSPQLDIHGLLHSIDEYFDQAECTKTHRVANNLLAEIYEKLSGEVNSVREWQPDWSQAPDNAKYWAMDGCGQCNWYAIKPEVCGNQWDFGRVIEQAHTGYGYQGNWRESLRERPHGK